VEHVTTPTEHSPNLVERVIDTTRAYLSQSSLEQYLVAKRALGANYKTSDSNLELCSAAKSALHAIALSYSAVVIGDQLLGANSSSILLAGTLHFVNAYCDLELRRQTTCAGMLRTLDDATKRLSAAYESKQQPS
jgi:hypothetical protein